MNIDDFLIKRQSNPFLSAPAPNSEQLNQLYQAANRAPDHGCIKPWRFISAQYDELISLGQILLSAGLDTDPNMDQHKQEKLLKNPQRAPMVITAIAKITEHPKAPRDEQLIAAGCAVHQLCLQANLLGFGTMWRTGSICQNKVLKSQLKLNQNEEVIGFIYLGTPSKQKPMVEALAAENQSLSDII